MSSTQDHPVRTPVTAEEIEDILVTSAGASPDLLRGSPGAALEDLGVDSLAVLELEAVLADRYGLEVPEGAVRMSIGEIVDHMRRAASAGTVS